MSSKLNVSVVDQHLLLHETEGAQVHVRYATTSGDLSKGESRTILIDDLPQSIDRASIVILHDNGKDGVSVGTHEFRYKEANPSTVKYDWIGQKVQVVQGGGSEKDTVLTGTLMYSGPDTVILNTQSYGLTYVTRVKTMSLDERSNKADEQYTLPRIYGRLSFKFSTYNPVVQLQYMMNKCGWQPEYTLVISSDLRQVRFIRMKALITNQTGSALSNMHISLLSGSMVRAVPQQQQQQYRRVASASMMSESAAYAPAPSSPSVTAMRASMYDRYEFKNARFDIAHNQTIEPEVFTLYNRSSIPWFEYRISEYDTFQPETGLDYGITTNTPESRIKFPGTLPSGIWYVYQSKLLSKSPQVHDDNESTLPIKITDMLGTTNQPRVAQTDTLYFTLGNSNHLTASHKLQVLPIRPLGQLQSIYEVDRVIKFQVTFKNTFSSKDSFQQKDMIVRLMFPTGNYSFKATLTASSQPSVRVTMPNETYRGHHMLLIGPIPEQGNIAMEFTFTLVASVSSTTR